MDSIKIIGGQPLRGTISIAGAKNACLALMPAALLTCQPLILRNVPRLSDVVTMGNLLQSIGVEVKTLNNGQVLAISSRDMNQHRADYNIVRKMRASILVLGALLARLGQAIVSLPGGCAIGARPVNLHLEALTKLGANIDIKNGYIHATVNSRRLHGAVIELPFVSVGVTKNILLAATLAKGTTEIRNAALEPEVVDLAHCLNEMGASIFNAGTSTIEIEGVDSLYGTMHTIIPDRIETGTYILAAAITGGDVRIENSWTSLLGSFIETLAAAGVQITFENFGIRVRRSEERLQAVDVVTQPYPGFPTDLQAQMMAAMTVAKGVSRLEERIFENRFMHVPELMRMGAAINISGNTAEVMGMKKLRGAPVMATDLRASVSLILAGLAAEGLTTINRIYHLDRGYECIEEKLSSCGANIERVRL